MSDVESKEYNQLDSFKRIEKWDIYQVRLSANDSDTLDEMGSVLGKVRPCLVISNNSFNKKDGQRVFSVIPIKTLDENTNMSEYQKFVPIKIEKSKDSLLCISQGRVINRRDFKNYMCTINNSETKIEILRSIIDYIINDEDDVDIDVTNLYSEK